MKTFIIGIDGATWSVMKPLIDEGKLPNIKSLMEEGASGNLETVDAEKYLSPSLWMSIDTGKHPDKHGIKDFYNTTKYDVKVKRLFQILDGLDNRIGLFRWYCTWPPEKNKGFTVPSWVARTSETYPDELEFITKLARHSTSKGYINSALLSLKNGVSLMTLICSAWRVFQKKLYGPSRRYWYYKERTLELKLYGEIFLHLARKYQINYGAILLSPVDALQHQYWKYYNPDGFNDLKEGDIQKYKHVIPSIYIEVDKFLGKLRGLLSEKDMLVVVSDHGMKSMKLEIGKSRPFKVKASSLTSLMQLDADFTSFSANFNTCIMLKNGSLNGTQLIQDTVKRLREIRLQRSGENIFQVLSVEDDRFFIKFNENLNFNENDIVDLGNNRKCVLNDLIIDRPEISASHDSMGIFILKNQHIKQNIWIEGAKLLDIHPTVLRVLDKPVARDLDGHVLEEIIKDDFLAGHPLKEIDTYENKDGMEAKDHENLTKEERAELQSKLHDLGYFD